MALIKNNPKSILLAFTGVIAVGFGTFAFAKDLVDNKRRAEEIRRIKRERRLAAFTDHNKLQEDAEEQNPTVVCLTMTSDTESVDNKRKRQDSIKGAEKAPTDTADAVTTAATTTVSATPESDSLATQELPQQQQQQQQHGSSPVKRPRTSEDGDDDVVHSPREENASLEEQSTAPEKKETPAPKPAAATAAVFGSKFSSGLGFASGIGATPNKPPAFAAYTGITSGFAKYASETTPSTDGGDEGVANTPKSPLAAVNVSSTNGNSKDVEGDGGEQTGANKKTFEDLLTADGKETLASNVALSSVVPAMAHANVSPAPVVPIRTHEEDETCMYTTKAKLFELVGDAWKERGNGHFKINKRNDDHNRRRMVMRTDQTFRLILNVSLFPGMKASCERRFVRFTNIDPETKTPITFALRLASEELATEVDDRINRFVPKASSVLPGNQDNKEDADASASDDSDGSADNHDDEEEDDSSDSGKDEDKSQEEEESDGDDDDDDNNDDNNDDESQDEEDGDKSQDGDGSSRNSGSEEESDQQEESDEEVESKAKASR
ncbi:hypothetical protein LPJ74_003226 [Coemansia sp. RSA 1843]|nr:hypothetical protein LPJ74_003226 [Coemansia sp. RSA 1843]